MSSCTSSTLAGDPVCLRVGRPGVAAASSAAAGRPLSVALVARLLEPTRAPQRAALRDLLTALPALSAASPAAPAGGAVRRPSRRVS